MEPKKPAEPATEKQLALLKKLNIEIPLAITKARAWQMIRYNIAKRNGGNLPYKMYRKHGPADHRFVKVYDTPELKGFFCRKCSTVKELIVLVNGTQRLIKTKTIHLNREGLPFKGKFKFSPSKNRLQEDK